MLSLFWGRGEVRLINPPFNNPYVPTSDKQRQNDEEKKIFFSLYFMTQKDKKRNLKRIRMQYVCIVVKSCLQKVISLIIISELQWHLKF